ncbi:MAG: transcriptional regulator, partial [Lactobacillus crispatus]|nr:transcriptional regulator [Lactobacillus crispatus]
PLQSEKSPLQSEKSPLQSEKSPLQSGKSPLQGEENNIIKKWKEKGIDKIFREQTIEKLLEFYMRYSSEYSFNRNLLANFLEIAPNSASKIIQKCREIGIMRMEKRGVYFFTDLG